MLDRPLGIVFPPFCRRAITFHMLIVMLEMAMESLIFIFALTTFQLRSRWVALP